MSGELASIPNPVRNLLPGECFSSCAKLPLTLVLFCVGQNKLLRKTVLCFTSLNIVTLQSYNCWHLLCFLGDPCVLANEGPLPGIARADRRTAASIEN